MIVIPSKRNVFCKINESGREIWEDMYVPGVKQKFIGLPYVEFDLIETHLRYPERTTDQLIGQQIGGNFADLIFQDPAEKNSVDEADMKFWFNEPIGGWRQGITRYYFLEEISIQNMCWPKLSRLFDGTLRKSIEDFNEGDIVEGFCESIHLNHGICIDFGCNFLGLLPITESEWGRLNAALPPEKIGELRPDYYTLRAEERPKLFKCKIRRKMNDKYFRWPLELDVIEPAWLREYVIPVGDYIPRLIAVEEESSNFKAKEYARVSGRRYNSPRRYSYSFADYSENLPWLQSQLDYFPEDHSQDSNFYEDRLPSLEKGCY
jgi:hypothetical protein